MIIIFSSDAYENITMFGNVAERLIRMMGSETKYGVIKSENISEALSRLQAGISSSPDEEIHVTDTNNDDEAEDRPVSLAHRALPLIEMLEASKKEDCEITWKIK